MLNVALLSIILMSVMAQLNISNSYAHTPGACTIQLFTAVKSFIVQAPGAKTFIRMTLGRKTVIIL